MKHQDIVIGAVYMVRVSGNFVAVRVAAPRANGERGWIGVNLRTQRNVLFRGAARLRYRLCEECLRDGIPVGTWGPEVAWCRIHAPKPTTVSNQEAVHA